MKNNQKGFSLVQVMIATGLVAIVAGGFYYFQNNNVDESIIEEKLAVDDKEEKNNITEKDYKLDIYTDEELSLSFKYPVELGKVIGIEKSNEFYKINFDNTSNEFNEQIQNNYNAEEDYKLEKISAESLYHPELDILFYIISYDYSNKKVGIGNQSFKMLKEGEIIEMYHINNLPSSKKQGVSVMHILKIDYISENNRYLITRECIYMCNAVRIFNLKTYENYPVLRIPLKDQSWNIKQDLIDIKESLFKELSDSY